MTASLLKSPGLTILAVLNNDGLHSSYYFQVLLSLYQYFCTKSTNYNWYNRHFHVPQFFQFLSKAEIFILLFTVFNFSQWSAGKAKSPILQVLFFVVVDYYKVWSSGWDYAIRLNLIKGLIVIVEVEAVWFPFSTNAINQRLYLNIGSSHKSFRLLKYLLEAIIQNFLRWSIVGHYNYFLFYKYFFHLISTVFYCSPLVIIL